MRVYTGNDCGAVGADKGGALAGVEVAEKRTKPEGRLRNLLSMTGHSPVELYQTVKQLSERDFTALRKRLGGPRRRQRTLLDCPPMEYGFRPFLEPVMPGAEPEHILGPRTPDTAPLAHTVLELLAGNQ